MKRAIAAFVYLLLAYAFVGMVVVPDERSVHEEQHRAVVANIKQFMEER